MLNSYKSKVRDEIEAQLSPASGIDKSWRRNASLALVQLNFDGHSCFSATDLEKTSQSSLRVSAIFEFLKSYGSANTAYADVKPFVENLEAGERGQLLSLLRTASDDVSLKSHKHLHTSCRKS
jgi:N-terminal acetyltransferase B complex non-catalytic subunit